MLEFTTELLALEDFASQLAWGLQLVRVCEFDL